MCNRICHEIAHECRSWIGRDAPFRAFAGSSSTVFNKVVLPWLLMVSEQQGTGQHRMESRSNYSIWRANRQNVLLMVAYLWRWWNINKINPMNWQMYLSDVLDASCAFIGHSTDSEGLWKCQEGMWQWLYWPFFGLMTLLLLVWPLSKKHKYNCDRLSAWQIFHILLVSWKSGMWKSHWAAFGDWCVAITKGGLYCHRWLPWWCQNNGN